MFDVNSGIARVWANLVKRGVYSINSVADLQNLREVVLQILNM